MVLNMEIYPHHNFHYINMMPPAQFAMYVTSRETVLMIPGKYTCPQNWVHEYYGYLMTERYNHKGRSTFECVDVAPKTITGGHANQNGAPVEPCCGSSHAFLMTSRRR